MAADIKLKLGTTNQALTITIASLANAAARQSTVVDNTTNLFIDALVVLKVKSAAASTSATGYVAIYAFATVDDGTTQTENAGASDAAITLTVPPNARLVGIVNVVANDVTYYGGPFSVAAAFGGILPAKWGLIIENKTAATLDATGGNHSLVYQGIYAQST